MPSVLDTTRGRESGASHGRPFSGELPPTPPADDDGGGGGDGDGDGGRPGDRRWVTLATFWHPTQAHIARLRLESAGVACVLLGELTTATHILAIATGGVKLQVPRTQFERAVRLLRRQPELGRPEPRVALADYERIIEAKAAACVVEAAGLCCEVIERSTDAIPRWGQWLGAALRARLWPAASVVVRREDLAGAASALVRTPLGRGLTPSARAARHDRCTLCSAEEDWAHWQLAWPGRLRLLPRLVLRCARCGAEWPSTEPADGR